MTSVATRERLVVLCVLVLLVLSIHANAQTDPLTSWNDGAAKQAIVAFTQALHDEAKNKGWFVISMKDDWKRIFAFDQ